MAYKNEVPAWARELAESIADTIEFSAPASIDCELSAPDETEWGVDFVELWPAVMEIQEAGPNDGELVFGIVQRFDLLATQRVFDEIDSFIFGLELDGRPTITIEGKYRGRKVAVIVNFEPAEEEDEDEDLE